MSDSFQHDDVADELDTLPPELLSLHQRLTNDSAVWQHHLPPAEALARFAHATPQQSVGAATDRPVIVRAQKGQVSVYKNTSTSQPAKQPYRVVIPAFVAVVVVVLLAVIFVQVHNGGHSTQPGNNPPTTATHAATSACVYHAAVPVQTTIHAIVMTSADDGWAIGQKISDGIGIGIMLHYAHCQWHVAGLSYPNLNLTGLVMLSSNDGWITGGSDDGQQQLLLHDIAGTWQRVTIPGNLAAGGRLDGIVMVSATEGWVEVTSPKDLHGIPHYRLLHYQQGNWTSVNVPIAYIADFSAAAPNDLWIVGSHQFNDGSTILAHYANGTWTQQQGPTQLEAARIHMTTITDGVVVFSLYGKNNVDQALKNVAWHYNGSTWTPLDLGGDRTGQEMYLFSSTQGWAFSKTYAPNDIGDTTPISGATYEVNGRWQTVAWHIPGVISVDCISRVSDDEYWATGAKLAVSSVDATINVPQSIFLHYSNGVWSEVGQ